MVQGAAKILLRLTKGDEYGVYRVTEDGQRYLLLAFDDRKEATAYGKMTASFLHVSLSSHLPPELLESTLGKSDSTVPNVSNTPKPNLKIKNVKGIGEYCKQLLYANTSDEEIIEAVVEKYLAVGRDEKYARDSAVWYLREAKRAIS